MFGYYQTDIESHVGFSLAILLGTLIRRKNTIFPCNNIELLISIFDCIFKS